MYLDTVHVETVGDTAFGVFGGSRTAGARKNEDAALIWHGEACNWTFAAVLDAHGSAESAEAVLQLLQAKRKAIASCLDAGLPNSFLHVEHEVVTALQSQEFLERCKGLSGETALLCVAQQDNFLWWLSIGDCVLYLFHNDLMRLGQYAINQRHFFQWVGEVNAFAQEVPTYTSGRFMLRQGCNDILLATDGVLECGTRLFEDGAALAQVVRAADTPQQALEQVLLTVQREQGRDSATALLWQVNNALGDMQPSA